MRWAYGVTTVPTRRKELLPRTLNSLKDGGFPSPRLFVDNCKSPREYDDLGLEVSVRGDQIKTAGHWMLSAWELYIRNPGAERYAIFQDDFVTYPNLRKYLDRCEYPKRGYWNLFTASCNCLKLPSNPTGGKMEGWFEASLVADHDKSEEQWQTGRGAVALVFNREALLTLFQSQHFVERPMDSCMGTRKIDGGIVAAMNKAGWREYVHSPSLVQHTGTYSSMGNMPHKPSPLFYGEGFDALELLKCA